jgi:NADH dehydrogenase
MATDRLVVDEFMAVPGADGVYDCGDCAAVPDLTRPGEITGMTAQHATRQGRRVARNVAASLGTGSARPYIHSDLGFLVDLGGLAAAANPLHIPLSGPLANALTRAYHVYAMSGNRARVPADWTLNTLTPPQASSFDVISAESVPLDVNEPRALTSHVRRGRNRCHDQIRMRPQHTASEAVPLELATRQDWRRLPIWGAP